MDTQTLNSGNTNSKIPRSKIVEIIKKKTGLDDVFSMDMEIGIYNWWRGQCIKCECITS